MQTIPKNQTHLAEMLGIAKSAVSAQARRGMPTTSLEAARSWRESNLDPARRKGTRFDENYQPQRKPAPTSSRSLVDQASKLMDAASALLDANQSIDALVPSLRAALHAVPPPERDDVGLMLNVMKYLVADVLAMCDPDPDALLEDGSPRPMTDTEAQDVGEFLYQCAAGEWVFP